MKAKVWPIIFLFLLGLFMYTMYTIRTRRIWASNTLQLQECNNLHTIVHRSTHSPLCMQWLHKSHVVQHIFKSNMLRHFWYSKKTSWYCIERVAVSAGAVAAVPGAVDYASFWLYAVHECIRFAENKNVKTVLWSEEFVWIFYAVRKRTIAIFPFAFHTNNKLITTTTKYSKKIALEFCINC